MTKQQIGSLERFEHDLGQDWTLIQLIDSISGIEVMRFINIKSQNSITLENNSVKALRHLMQNQ